MTDRPSPPRATPSYPWYMVLCLVGLNYFSTLAYLPSIAVLSSRALAPVAAAGVVLLTLLVALPVYWYVVGRSPHGKGGLGLLERSVHGWGGKLLLLVLLGFVATDFVITRSLSVADAATHVVGNSFWKEHNGWFDANKEAVRGWLPGGLRGRFFDFWDEQLVLAIVLTVLAFGLYAALVRGLSRGLMRLAVGVVGLYLLLTLIVVGSGVVYVAGHPELFTQWEAQVRPEVGNIESDAGSALGGLLLIAVFAFPPMALGLSGLELSAATAPLVQGDPGDDPARPRGRIWNTRKMLLVAALMMSLYVLGSVFVVTVLLPPGAIEPEKGQAQHRALAYLAHGGALAKAVPGSAVNPLFGPWFGTLYDLSTVLILCLAGASATVALRDLVPDFLSRFGMQLVWAHRVGVTLLLFNVVILLVTIAFRASVGAQMWAYAASVLALLIGASLAATADVRQRWRGSGLRWLVSAPFLLGTVFLLLMGVVTVVQDQSGLAIAGAFVGVVFVTAAVSRWLRSTELRFAGWAFADEATKARWEEVRRLEFQVLVPHDPTGHTLAEKEAQMRQRHRLGPEVPIIFIEVRLGDPSDFVHAPVMQIEREEGREVVRVSRCTSVAHVLAAIALAFREVGRPPEIHFGWSDESPHAANLHFLLLGQGNVPWMVHALLRKAEPDPARRPGVVIGPL